MSRPKSGRQQAGGGGPSPSAAAPSARGVSLAAVALLLLAMVTAYMYPLLTAEPAPPELPDRWWAAGAPPTHRDTGVHRFTIRAPADTMDDIRVSAGRG